MTVIHMIFLTIKKLLELWIRQEIYYVNECIQQKLGFFNYIGTIWLPFLQLATGTVLKNYVFSEGMNVS